MPHTVRSQLLPYFYYYTKHRHKLPHCSTSKLPKLASKAARTTSTNTWRSTLASSMKASLPTNLSTYWQLSMKLTPASPSPHSTLAQLSDRELKMRHKFFYFFFLIRGYVEHVLEVWSYVELTGLYRWTPRHGRIHAWRGYQALRWRRNPCWLWLAQHLQFPEQSQM